MQTYLARAGVAGGTAALVVSSLLATASPAHAADGTLVVSVVDQYGRPTTGVVFAFDSGGGEHDDGSSGDPTVSSTHTFTLAPGGYALENATPWSGVSCEGAAPCGLADSPTTVTPVVTVPDGGTATYTTHVVVPSISGSPAIGSPLTIQIPQPVTDLLTLFNTAPGYGGDITRQWVRGATDLPGATNASYTTVRDDGGQALSARLMPSPGMSIFFGGAGIPVAPFSTNVVNVAKAVKFKTKTKTSVAGRIGVGERATVTVKVKAKHTKNDPDGYVTLTVGSFKARKALKKGAVFITLPPLKAGTYHVLATYTGSEDYKKSKAKKTTITVGR